jgi:hypothetical protein
MSKAPEKPNPFPWGEGRSLEEKMLCAFFAEPKTKVALFLVQDCAEGPECNISVVARRKVLFKMLSACPQASDILYDALYSALASVRDTVTINDKGNSWRENYPKSE